ncbi:insecticidal delta-endotoxin Cry8Ea1 family protein [Bacillus thuringiensis]|uniref:insecticidal delta-endotoxin Cry8Ea1 family protein n=1 Tax=Bacillus thuringiensis TaxID=1428 RepID=UPI001482CBB8|nr:insecticidal delta-endotoxin Cry8Ea1 family protein [Bacillus thuringiensis]
MLEPGIGGIPVILSIINKLIPSSGQSVAALSICDLLSIIRKEVDESVLSDGVADFKGEMTAYRDYYLPYLEDWLTDKSNPEKLADVVKQFQAREEDFTKLLAGSLSRQKAEILLLPTYVQAANVHLLLLRDAVKYKKEWGLVCPPLYPGSGRTDCNERLKAKIKEYTNYCVEWYNKGLDQIKQAGTSTETWLKFNKFRREMTLAVLDVIAIFPTYDFEKYPLATNVELTREVYTDPVGYSGSSIRWERTFPNAFNTLEANGTRGPGLVTWLEVLGIYNHDFQDITVYFSGWVGSRHSEDYTRGNGTFSRISGTTSNDIRNQTFYSRDVFKIDSLGIYETRAELGYTRQRFCVSRAVFSSTLYNYVYDARNNGQGRMTIESMLPGIKNPIPSSQDYSHRLSNAACVQFNDSRINVYGWTHTSMTKNNPIYTDKISQIPAVKAFALESGAYVSRGPGHTGGDVVTLPNRGRLKIRLTSAPTNKNYRVRVRYATSYGADLMVQRWSPSGNHASGYFSGSPTGSYPTFGYMNTLVTTFNQSGVEIIIENRHYSNIIIDKIEFIPDDITTLEYEGERDLEKTKNAVNDLFTN